MTSRPKPARGTPFQPVPFAPRRLLANGHLQTIVGNYLRRTDALPPAEPELVTVSAAAPGQPLASQVLCHSHWQPAGPAPLTVVLVHGLEGSSQSQYIVGNANKLWRAGCSVVRMNMRNCGGTERLSPTLYHSGMSGDVDAVMRHFIRTRALPAIALVGYSMGGNLVLKLAGELGAMAPAELRAVVGISPAVDLGPSADALHRPLNRVYELKFLHALTRRFRRKAALFPRTYDPARADYLRSLREFDDRITAFYSGFAGADDYYWRAAAARVIQAIRVPTLIVHAADDPFIKITSPTRASIAANPGIAFLEPAHGGHCAFLAAPRPGTQPSAVPDDGYWAETTLLGFLLTHLHPTPLSG